MRCSYESDRPLLQRVQQQLREGEAASKDDASPVTVADYGMSTRTTP